MIILEDELCDDVLITETVQQPAFEVLDQFNEITEDVIFNMLVEPLTEEKIEVEDELDDEVMILDTIASIVERVGLDEEFNDEVFVSSAIDSVFE